jgi:1-phosphatidylinositol-3-phosphate 5-kinase
VLYPEQFDALRRTYDCEKSMIESLARCVKWNACGGKSGSAFLKTRGLSIVCTWPFLPDFCQDGRFIAKELSKAELQTMETFAPAYFDFMSSAVSGHVSFNLQLIAVILFTTILPFQRPTLLAKVFGCYKLTFKKTGKDKGSSKSKSTQMNLLVMENLFYDRRFSKVGWKLHGRHGFTHIMNRYMT